MHTKFLFEGQTIAKVEGIVPVFVGMEFRTVPLEPRYVVTGSSLCMCSEEDDDNDKINQSVYLKLNK